MQRLTEPQRQITDAVQCWNLGLVFGFLAVGSAGISQVVKYAARFEAYSLFSEFATFRACR